VYVVKVVTGNMEVKYEMEM